MNFPRYIIKWISEFLKDCKFKVTIGEGSSALVSIQAGVPQGAVLSPILFSIYINDIPCFYEKNKKYGMLFADDLVAYFIFKKTKQVSDMINKYSMTAL